MPHAINVSCFVCKVEFKEVPEVDTTLKCAQKTMLVMIIISTLFELRLQLYNIIQSTFLCDLTP